jgi:hypothetical protein
MKIVDFLGHFQSKVQKDYGKIRDSRLGSWDIRKIMLHLHDNPFRTYPFIKWYPILKKYLEEI